MAKRGSKEWKENISKGVNSAWFNGKYDNVDYSKTEEHRKKLRDFRQGKTYEQIYGIKLANELRQVKRQQALYNNPNKGKKHPGLNKGNKFALGYHWTEEAKIKYSIKRGGPLKGFYTSTRHEWDRIRTKIKERDEFTCQSCHKKLPSNCLDVHHIIPFKYTKDNSENNLVTLCKPCHSSIEHFTNLQYGDNNEENTVIS